MYRVKLVYVRCYIMYGRLDAAQDFFFEQKKSWHLCKAVADAAAATRLAKAQLTGRPGLAPGDSSARYLPI